MIKNLTPHAITIVREGGIKLFIHRLALLQGYPVKLSQLERLTVFR